MGEQRRNVIAHGIAMGLDAQGWSKPRTVDSIEELEALPIGSLIRAVRRPGLTFGTVYEKTGREWLELDPGDRDDGDHTTPPGWIVNGHEGGILVLFIPEVKA